VADSLEETGDRLFTFTRLDPPQWKSARMTSAIERLNEEFRRRIKTQTVLSCAETVPTLLWELIASGQGKWTIGKRWLSPSHRSALTSRPDQTQIPIPGERRQRITTSFGTPPQNPAFTAITDKFLPFLRSISGDTPIGNQQQSPPLRMDFS
tara:strand:+ start:131 stop:586 length:456 start_codon:yes stop_codon:yes gene_type:complete